MANQGMGVVDEAVAVLGAATCAAVSVQERLWQTGRVRAADSWAKAPRVRRNKRRERVVWVSGQPWTRQREESHHLEHQETGEEEDEMRLCNLRPKHVRCGQWRALPAVRRHHQRS